MWRDGCPSAVQVGTENGPLLGPAPPRATLTSSARRGGGPGKSQGESVPETLVTHLEPQNIRLEGMPGRGLDLSKVTP